MALEFNENQKKALESNKSLIISAGAGSGKTAVLTEKVYEIINDKNNDINPENLLVLTFTDKAAYQMKTKIIAKFEKNGSKFASQIASSHIQTFDSFASFLVKKYSTDLNINPNFNVVDEAIISTKANELLDDILNEYYLKKDESIKKLLNKYCFKNDSNLKTIILDVKNKVDRFDPLSKDNFLFNYENTYLNKEKLEKVLKEYIDNKYYKGIKHYYDLIKDIDNNETLKESNLYKALNDVFSSINFYASYLTIFDSKVEYRGNNKEVRDEIDKLEPGSSKKLTALINELRKLLNNDFINETILKVLSFKEDIKTILSLVNELNKRLDEYKYLSSSYTFNDVQLLSLKLLFDKRFEKIKDEIRSTFKFILVDEYQDTNDIQESFINALSDNSTNKLFLVGDMKQSIYRFRFANPKLFIKRREDFKLDKSKEAIDMNINYRSLPIILKLVNKYFMKNMSINNGGLSFEGGEKLDYDLKKDLFKDYKESSDNERGFNFLISSSINKNASNEVENGIILIINDIISKIKSGYKVIDIDKNDKLYLRNCVFSDFAILTKRKTNYLTFKKLFEEYKIPLNIAYDDDIRVSDSIIVIESLTKLFYELRFNNNEYNIKHNFVSIVRSYLYSYSDQKIYDLIKNNSYKNDEVYLKMLDFVSRHSSSSLSETILDLINEFNVIKVLNHNGDIFNNINQIEYVYSLTNQLENGGSQIEDFNLLLASLEKYKIKLSQETLFSSENSVELMTIHKSKGLEFKICYIPLDECNLSFNNGNDNLKGIKISLDKDLGLFLPNIELDNEMNTIFKTLLDENEKQESKNEYERLLYVAFTREKESLYFVNPRFNPAKSSLSYKNMMNRNSIMPEIFNAFEFKFDINEDYLDVLFKEEVINKEEINEIKKLIELTNYFSLKKANKDLNKMAIIKNSINFSIINSLVSDIVKNLYKKDKVSKFEEKDFFDIEKIDDNISALTQEKCEYSLTFLTKSLFELTKRLNYGLFKKIKGKIKIGLIKQDDPYFIEKMKYNSLFNNYMKILKDDEVEVISLEKFENRTFLRFLLLFYPSYLKNPLFNINFIDFKTKYLSIDEDIISLSEGNKIVLPLLNVNDKNYEFKEKTYKRASKELSNEDKYNEELKASLDYGTHMHFLLESLDFINPDFSYIVDLKERKRIENVRNLDIFDDVDESTHVFSEYQYEMNNIEGSIDLLLVYKDKIKIIDYKTSSIDDKEYIRQLNIYRKVIERDFKDYKQVNNIKMYLLSIVKEKYKEVEKVDA